MLNKEDKFSEGLCMVNEVHGKKLIHRHTGLFFRNIRVLLKIHGNNQKLKEANSDSHKTSIINLKEKFSESYFKKDFKLKLAVKNQYIDPLHF